MNREIRKELQEKGVDIVRFLDLTRFPELRLPDFPKAILFGIPLSRQFVLDIRHDRPTACDEYLEKEHLIEETADRIARYIREKGFRARSQSERSNLENGNIEQAYIDPLLQQGVSSIPQKTLARLAGLGFIGKNNLLVTREYGCALALCSVLTDAPMRTEEYPLIPSQCGTCAVCKTACTAQAIHGNQWTREGGREALVDVSKCCCPLKCMMHCPWTLKYAHS